jgi:hypothetical protein
MIDDERKSAYRAKELVWVFIILTFLCLALSGCSSAPKQTAQFCNTSQTIQVKNGEKVNSETVVKCSDNFIDRHVPAQAGVDRNCREVITQYGRSFACETHRPGYFVYVPDPANL